MPCIVGTRFGWFCIELRCFELKEDGFSGNGEQRFGVWGCGFGNGGRNWGVDSDAAVEADM